MYTMLDSLSCFGF